MDNVGDALTNSYWSWIQVFNSYLVYNLFFECTARGTTALADLALYIYIYMCSLSLRTHSLLHTRFREFLWCTSYGERGRALCVYLGLGFCESAFMPRKSVFLVLLFLLLFNTLLLDTLTTNQYQSFQ